MIGKALIFFVVVSVAVLVRAQDSICTKKGEMFTTCGSACPDTCESLESGPQMCTLQCIEGCFCRPGLVRDHNGDCIKPEKCPSKHDCLENEEWNDCGLRCQPSCTKPFPACDKRCHAGCFCREGYIRQDNSEYSPCIPTWQCYN